MVAKVRRAVVWVLGSPLIILGIVAVVFVFARRYLDDRKLFIGEFYTLTLFSTLGMMLLVSAGSLITAYLGLELLALSSYALVALNRDSAVSAEAEAMSKALKKAGFSFVGPTICYAYMQSSGMVMDHTVDCDRYAVLTR